jgi:opacity protein-like surface antigen
MKRIIILSIASLISIVSYAQRDIEITGFGGYMLNGDIKTYYGNYPVADNPNYGGILSIEGFENTFFELMYNRNDTRFSYTNNGIITSGTVDVAVEYYQVGSLHQLDVHDIIKPFGILTLGAVRFHPKNTMDLDGDNNYVYEDDAWRFGATIGAGLKILLNDRLAVRLQARLMLPMEFNGLFVGIGTGGVSGGTSFVIPLVSGDFTAGIVLRLGK